MSRFFVKLQQIHNNIVTFDKAQSKKIKKVLRFKVGDLVTVFDGKGWEYEAQLVKIEKDYTIAKVIDQKLVEEKSQVTLVQALPKNLKIEFIIQKCTELGVDRIIFFSSKFSQIDGDIISEEKLKRWRKIATEASEQCKRIFVPEIELFTGDLAELLPHLKQDLYYLDIMGKFLNSKLLIKDSKNLCFFVGPEGGFSQDEKELLEKSKAVKVKVAENILRSETAGMTFLSQLIICN
jgi:16S rRNA (uracil1498-N3)-methyltransferase